jgi:hypothetical protein
VKQAKPQDGGYSQMNPALRYSRAGVAEWQTQRTQNPPGSRPCRFDSYLLRVHTLKALQNLNKMRFVRLFANFSATEFANLCQLFVRCGNNGQQWLAWETTKSVPAGI